VLAFDGTDAEAPARRRAVRGIHFEGIKPMVERGELRAAGAILDDAGNMIGSVVFVDFPNRAALDAWFDREPYAKNRAWKRIEAVCNVLPEADILNRRFIRSPRRRAQARPLFMRCSHMIDGRRVRPRASVRLLA
jgi:uncharacterized protein YciI